MEFSIICDHRASEITSASRLVKLALLSDSRQTDIFSSLIFRLLHLNFEVARCAIVFQEQMSCVDMVKDFVEMLIGLSCASIHRAAKRHLAYG
jgi:hypothetical protein